MSKKINELTPQQHQAALLLAEGRTGQQVAETLNVASETVSRWRRNPEFEALINRCLADAAEATRFRLRNAAVKAVSVVEGALDDADADPKDRNDHDKALILKRTTAADVARAVGCNRSAVTRHLQNHVMPEIAAAYLAEAEPELKHVDVLAEMTELYRRMKEHLNKAEGADDWQAIRAFHAEARKDLELLAKLLGELQQEGAVNVLIAPEWLSIRAQLIQAIEPYPQARKAVLEALAHADA